MSDTTKQTNEHPQLKRALVALKEMRTKLEAVEQARTEPIAIIGLGCRFPGGADNPETFWQMLRNGVDTVKEIPPNRWDINDFFDSDQDAPGKMYTRYGSFLNEVDKFDPLFFGISPREAASMDPHQRLLLEVSWEALEHAGLAPDKLAGSPTGVFVGMSTSDYIRLMFADPMQIDTYSGTGTNNSIASGRLSYLLGLHGPSMVVDTACSSALVALHLACQSLRAGECRMALSGGVGLILAPGINISFSKARMMSPEGHCKTFDAAADGYVRGEGCGLIVLKRLSDAIADGDNILALIRSSAVNQDGRSNGLTAPNGLAQEAVIREALAKARISPAEVNYVEAHGTGTSLGDPIEVQALGAVLSEGRSDDNRLLIGSVKTNIGHLEATSGIAGLIKVVMALQHQEIPPHLHLHKLSPHIPWEEFPITVPTELTPWPTGNGQRIAGVSSYGFGGTNTHVVVQEAPITKSVQPEVERSYHLLNLSAKNEQGLNELAARFEEHLASLPEESFTDVCFTANTGRSHFAHRLAVIAESASQARTKLTAFAAGQAQPGILTGKVPETEPPEVVFLFTGQGSQYVGMGRKLYETQPTFRAALDKCDELLQPYLKQSLLSVLYPEDGESPINETAYTQPALFALEYALAELWQSWGIKPAAVMGHSVGEYVAACVAGVFSLEDGLKLIAERGRLMQSLPKDGMMAVVFADEAQVTAAIASHTDLVSIAAINDPQNIVISGQREAVQTVVEQFEAKGTRVQPLNVSHAFHSPLMEPILDSFEQTASQVTFHAPNIPLVSNVTGQIMGQDEIPDAVYWRQHIREGVRFADAIETLYKNDYELFLEVGPGPVLLGMGKRCLPQDSGVWVPSLRRGRDDWQQILDSLGTLHIQGIEVAWDGFDRDYPRRRMSLPTYPFQRQRYWIKNTGSDKHSVVTSQPSKMLHPLLGQRLRSAMKEIQFETQLSSDWLPFLTDHQIYGAVVVPATAFMEMGLAAATEAFGPGTHRLEEITIQEPLILPDDETRTLQLIATPKNASQASFQILSLVEDEEWKLHVTGKIHIKPADSGPMLEEVPLATIQERCQLEADAIAFYSHLQEIGLDYRPRFQGNTQIWHRDGEMLAQVQLPDSITSEADDYQFHPALLDSCLQSVLLHYTLPFLGRDSSEAAAEETIGDIYIPLAFERFGVYRHSPRRVWSHILIRPEDKPNRERYTADMRFLDETGQVVAEIQGLHLKRAPRQALQHAIQPNFNKWLYEIDWQTQARTDSTRSPESTGDWLIFADENGIGTTLAERLQAQGERLTLVHPGETFAAAQEGNYWQVNPACPDDFERLLREALPSDEQSWRGMVHLWSTDTPTLAETDINSLEKTQQLNCGSVLHLIQALKKVGATESPRLWLVTRGSQPVGTGEALAPAQASLWGLGHTIALEHPELQCVRVDLDPTTDNPVTELFDDIWMPDSEDRIAYRDGNRHIARLIRSTDTAKDKKQSMLTDQPFQLEITERGVLDNLVLQPTTRRKPAAGEVEIRVRATGLNFRDVLKGLGMYPGNPGPFGDECAGEVVAIGEGVTDLQIGDKVFGVVPGCFRKFATTSAQLVVRMPEKLTYEEAATIPITFLTAYYALHHIGKMTAGERVLVHAAAGGVGMAAVQLAQRAGVEVFATASTGKWETLRAAGVKYIMNSRTLDFADEILTATNGQGVDLVLNSLNGDFIPKSLSAMTDTGRFLEIGKVGIWDKEQVAEAKSEASYDIIFLDEIRQEEPALIRSMLLELVEALEDGSLKPLPRHVFPIQDVSEAFRFMAHAKHIGKIIVTQGDNEGGTAFHANATYLVTGGLGGLGLAVAQWMVRQGARNLVLVGRRGASEAAQEVLNDLAENGVRVAIARGDISQQADVSRILSEIDPSTPHGEAGLPPLRGIVHAAGILDDGVLLQQNWSRFAKVMAPKVDGAWYLHSLTRNMSLDFFVMFSSATTVLGSVGQANYVAANSFLDVLAYYRRSQGLPALSLSWGPWGQVGMMAALDDRDQRRWAKQGVGFITPEQGVKVMEEVLDHTSAHLAVMPIDWPAFFRANSGNYEPPLFAELAQEAQSKKKAEEPSAASESTLLKQLGEAPSSKHKTILVDHIRNQARMVFGLDSSYPIDQRQSFGELGLDSLMAVELRNALSNSLDTTLPATLLFDYPTLETLADFLKSEVLPESANGVNDNQADLEIESAQQKAIMAELEELSDDEAEALLLAELFEGQNEEVGDGQ